MAIDIVEIDFICEMSVPYKDIVAAAEGKKKKQRARRGSRGQEEREKEEDFCG